MGIVICIVLTDPADTVIVTELAPTRNSMAKCTSQSGPVWRRLGIL